MLEPHRELVSLLRRKLELLLLLRAGGEDLLRGLTAPPRTDRDPPRDPTGCALRWLAEQDVLLRRLRLLDREVRERCGVLAAALGCPGETSLGGLEARLPEALRKELAGLRGELLARARELERLQLTLAVVADHGRRVTRRLMDIAAHLAPEDRKDPSMVNVVV